MFRPPHARPMYHITLALEDVAMNATWLATTHSLATRFHQRIPTDWVGPGGTSFVADWFLLTGPEFMPLRAASGWATPGDASYSWNSGLHISQ